MRAVALLLAMAGAWFARADRIVPILDASVDVSRPARGIQLSFVRSYATSTNSIGEKGLLGYGWYDNLTACFRCEGPDVLVFPDSPVDGQAFVNVKNMWHPANPRDATELSETSSAYVLKYENGAIRSFSKENMRTSFIQDNQGNSLNFTWNGNELLRVAHTDGQSLTFTYANGLIASVVDDCGRKTEFQYSDDYLVGVVSHDGRFTKYEYGDAGTNLTARILSRVIRPNGAATSFTFDVCGRVSSIAEGTADGKSPVHKTTITRSSDGVAVIVGPDGGRSLLKFGRRGEVLQTTDALGNARRYAYSTNGLLESVTSPSGGKVSVEHDKNGRIAALVAASGAMSKFSYTEPFGNLARAMDVNGQGLSYDYDSLGRATAVTFPDGSSCHLSYNARGDMTESRNRRVQAIARICDAQGRVIRMTWPDGRTFQYAYDAHGNLIMAQDSETGVVTMSYDKNDRMIRIAYPGNRGIEFAYDSLGRFVERKLFGGECDGLAVPVEKFAYNADGMLASVTDGNGKPYLANVYDPKTGRLAKQTYGNGVVIEYGYDLLGRIALIKHDNMQFFEYTYDADGRCIASRSQEGWETYAYDADGQLTTVFYPSGTKDTFSYDPVGNRKVWGGAPSSATVSYTVNSLNQYTTISSLRASESPRLEHLAYDLDGNMVSQKDEKDETRYFYDVLNRLVAVTNETEGVHWSCKYDALGNRVSITDNGITTERVFIPGVLPSVAAEFVDGKLTKRHIVAGVVHVATLTTSHGAPTTTYYHGDIIGSVRLVTDESGREISRSSYTAFGFPREGRALSRPSSVGYVGMLGVETDPTGLLFMRNRYYSPVFGRFITPDPIGLAGGDVNWYRYCGNDPVVKVDVNGYSSFGQNMGKIIFGSLSVAGGFISGMATPVIGPLGVAGTIEGVGGGGILIYDGLRDIIQQDPVLNWVAEHVGGFVKEVAVGTAKSVWKYITDPFPNKNAIPESTFLQELKDTELRIDPRIWADEDGTAHYEQSFSHENSFAPDLNDETKNPTAKNKKRSAKQRNSSRQSRNQRSAKDAKANKDDDELSPDQIPDPDNDSYIWCEDVCGEEGLRYVCPADTAHCIYWGCSRCGHVIRKKARKAKRQERIWKAKGIEGVWHGTQFDIRQAKSAD